MAIGCIGYFVLIGELGGAEFIRSSLFYTDDSQAYRGYAQWISGESTFCNPNRSYFYPLLLVFAQSFGGLAGIWLMQFLLWVAGCILIYCAALRISERKTIAVVALVLAISNISLMVYTVHALTEIVCFFFLALLVYLLSGNFRNPKGFLPIVFIAGVVVAIKPQFQPLWYLLIAFFLVCLYRDILRRPTILFLLLAASSPVAVQFAINKSEHNTFSNSAIAHYNLRNSVYKKVLFFTEYKSDSDGPDFDHLSDSAYVVLHQRVQIPDDDEIVDFLKNHKAAFINVWSDNVLENLQSGNSYIDREKHHTLSKWVENINHNIKFGLHVFCFIAWTWFVVSRAKRRDSIYVFILFCGITFYYIILTSGTVYWAGDRLLISSVAIWSTLYPVLLTRLFSKK